MINIKRIQRQLLNLIEDNKFSTKIQVFTSKRTVGEDYDPYEKLATFSNLNPIFIKGYVCDIDSTKLVYKQLGLSEQGAVEIIVNGKYEELLKIASKIIINDKEYHVYKEGTGNRFLITHLQFNLIKAVLRKNE